MSYNGVGLSTPRGSGTNGHITRNLSNLRPREKFDDRNDGSDYTHRAPDQGILEHERRRRVEVKCLELEVSLQDDGVEEDLIVDQVSALRTKLLAESASAHGTERAIGSIKVHERHELGQAKELQNERLRLAMGISKDHVEGLAFDREAQAQMKIQKQEEREKAREERAKIEAQLKVDRDKAAKEREELRRKDDLAIAAAKRAHDERLLAEGVERQHRAQEEMRRLDADLDARRAPPGGPPPDSYRRYESRPVGEKESYERPTTYDRYPSRDEPLPYGAKASRPSPSRRHDFPPTRSAHSSRRSPPRNDPRPTHLPSSPSPRSLPDALHFALEVSLVALAVTLEVVEVKVAFEVEVALPRRHSASSMSTIFQLPVTLPLLPKGYKAPAFSPLSPATTSKLLPVGSAFHSHARRVLNQRDFEEDDKALHAEHLANGGAVVEEDDEDSGLGDEQEDKALLQSDPKLWKHQDHYAVLGLQSLRYKATDEQIKKAHRRKVLRHHPDKKASGGGDANDDSFFKCIAKAMEVLSSPEKRRQFDSVDAEVEDDIPEPKDTTPENFFELWAPVFEREGRFSVVQPVPQLGDDKAAKGDVEAFYNFWYSIDSWRTFEALDKDVNEGSDSRDEKRHNEKKNKSERQKRKKEDNTRVRTLVDAALALDPRIKQFKADEKAARDAKKKGGVAGVVDVKKEEEEVKAKADAEAAAAAEAAKSAADDKTTREAAKKVKAAAAKNVKKDRKAISAVVTANNYFVPTGTSPSPSVVEGTLSELDVLFGALEPEETVELKKEIEAAKDPQKIKAAIVSWAAKKGPAGKFKEFA